jgi:hypothetical protein
VLCKLLKAPVDPNAAPVRALSREQRELMIAANNSYLLAFDNLSGLFTSFGSPMLSAGLPLAAAAIDIWPAFS